MTHFLPANAGVGCVGYYFFFFIHYPEMCCPFYGYTVLQGEVLPTSFLRVLWLARVSQ